MNLLAIRAMKLLAFSGLMLIVSCNNESQVNRFASFEGNPGQVETLNILSHEGFVKLTQCASNENIKYQDAFSSALQYLVFSESKEEANEWDYRRRHIRPFFQSIENTKVHKIPDRCLTESIIQIGEHMGLLSAEGSATKSEFYYDSNAKISPVETSMSLQVTSRHHYIEETACLLSPESWKIYQNVIKTYLFLGTAESTELSRDLKSFFNELQTSQPAEGKLIADHCWTKGLRKLATKANLI